MSDNSLLNLIHLNVAKASFVNSHASWLTLLLQSWCCTVWSLVVYF